MPTLNEEQVLAACYWFATSDAESQATILEAYRSAQEEQEAE